ncbi:hypothetical protein [Streptomyces sp. NBC_00829]|uniref:hypothetical protein n=1 Tax=Streptomyces sp. NBC_00829 TaxID=2903679 RepID=UPI00386DE6AD|nr:hypothetical protein OG293_38615 [Streptomyces sp. NBC_00829]
MPRVRLPRLQWECSTGTGLIVHATVVRRKLKKYVACRVAMDDGFQLRGRLIAAHPLSIAAGTRVRLDLSADPVPTPFAFRPQQIADK